MTFPSTMLAQSAEPIEIQKADLDLLDKINKVAAGAAASSTAGLQKGYLYGLALSNGTDTTNDIAIAAGECVDSAGAELMQLAAALTKRLDAAWEPGTNGGGLDTGAIANTTYHVWVIKRTDTGVVDALFSLSATAPTMPANYTKKRRIGAIIRSGATILAFTQIGDRFMLKTVIDSRAWAALPNTTRNLVTVTSPPSTPALLRISEYSPTAAYYLKVEPVFVTDVAATAANAQYLFYGSGYIAEMPTDGSSQVAYRGSNIAIYIGIQTLGWIDTRGRDA